MFARVLDVYEDWRYQVVEVQKIRGNNGSLIQVDLETLEHFDRALEGTRLYGCTFMTSCIGKPGVLQLELSSAVEHLSLHDVLAELHEMLMKRVGEAALEYKVDNCRFTRLSNGSVECRGTLASDH